MTRLHAAYAELQARDAAYRELLKTSQGNVDRLQAANRQLQAQLVEASARLRLLREQVQAARSREHDEDDD